MRDPVVGRFWTHATSGLLHLISARNLSGEHSDFRAKDETDNKCCLLNKGRISYGTIGLSFEHFQDSDDRTGKKS